MKRLLLAAVLFLLPGIADAACPPVPFVFANGSPFDANKANQDWEALRNCFNAGVGVGAHIPTNVALLAASTESYPGGVWRDDYAVGLGAPPLFYFPSNSACSLAGGNGDNGSQVKSANNLCWVAHFDAAGADLRQWGARADSGATDSAPIIVKALAAAAGQYCILVPQSSNNYFAIKTPITLPTGSDHCLKSPLQWATLLQPNGTNLPSMITSAGALSGVLLENIEFSGNGENNLSGGPLIDFSNSNTVDVTLNNLYVHNSPSHGAIIAGNGIFVNGGFYTNNGVNPGTLFGGGLVVGSGGHSFTIQGVNAHTNATYGIACAGTCYDGVINGNLVFNNGAGTPPNTADNITGYSANVHDVVISDNIVYGGGNNGIHFGGNRVTYSGNVVRSPAFYGIMHTSTKAYSAGR